MLAFRRFVAQGFHEGATEPTGLPVERSPDGGVVVEVEGGVGGIAVDADLHVLAHLRELLFGFPEAGLVAGPVAGVTAVLAESHVRFHLVPPLSSGRIIINKSCFVNFEK